LSSQKLLLHALTLFLKHSCTIQALQYQDFISLSTTSRQIQHPMSQKTQEKRHISVKNPLFLTVLAYVHCCPPFLQPDFQQLHASSRPRRYCQKPQLPDPGYKLCLNMRDCSINPGDIKGRAPPSAGSQGKYCEIVGIFGFYTGRVLVITVFASLSCFHGLSCRNGRFSGQKVLTELADYITMNTVGWLWADNSQKGGQIGIVGNILKKR